MAQFRQGQKAKAGIHDSDCPALGMPEIDPEVLLADIQDEAVVAYLQEVRPVYERLKRVLGQFSGVFILAQTTRRNVDRDRPLVTTAREQLAQAADAAGRIVPPGRARRHHACLLEVAEHLTAVSDALTRRVDLLVPDSHDLSEAMRRLYAAHARLLAVSDERAGMTPVDFSQACCCGSAAAGGQGSGAGEKTAEIETH
ncbi:hypothetical protein [Rhodovibrio salinarum]|uniref:Uncharacterized protein n=1 Tax=Rhodovibrio salinarum TaxID=1087 RepID=A0A934QFP1_9PROT|nr:hypothetical protein [Rhodovibrio salinarum]MBK1696143.1 hypothetical protein [Rhodovibrio salinarum]